LRRKARAKQMREKLWKGGGGWEDFFGDADPPRPKGRLAGAGKKKKQKSGGGQQGNEEKQKKNAVVNDASFRNSGESPFGGEMRGGRGQIKDQGKKKYFWDGGKKGT